MPCLFARATFAAAVIAALGCALAGGRAHAQAQGLKLQRALGEAPSGRGDDIATFVTADRIEGFGGEEVEAVGAAEIRRGNTIFSADRIKYLQDDDEAEAIGNVRLRIGEDEMIGPRLRLRLGDTTGIFDRPSFRLAPRTARMRSTRGLPSGPKVTGTEPRPQIDVEGRGEGKALRFEGEERYRVTDGSFTTCRPGQDDWFLEAGELDLDFDRQVGTARDARLTFLGATTPTIPWFDFSLNNERKSGFLPPAFGVQGKVGPELLLPFYWNIAPNYDATITPRFMEQRGTQFLNEFRFLQPYVRGRVRYEILPEDKDLGERRYATALNSDLNFQNGWTGLVNYQRVSDDDYFRDLSGRLSIATQTHLPQQALATYGASWWSATANMQRFQTLQDPKTPVPVPYFRAPQLTLTGLRQTVGGLDVGFGGEYVDFHNSALVPTGRRVTGYPYVTWPSVATYGYLTPKVGLSATAYNLTTLGTFPDETPTRALPIMSVDSGLVFEREARWFGSDYLQTLEPRVYYLNVPVRDQTRLPVFDTTTADFNYTQLFQENIFAGGDRIANANQVSLGATSRLIRPRDGQELLRAVIGQRYYFAEQQVTIPSQPVRTDKVSPLILGLAGRIAPSWTAEVSTQYQFLRGGAFDKFVSGLRYSPAPASVASISYRSTLSEFTAGAGRIENVDIAAQWPLGRGVYGVGRFNYDLAGGKPVESLAGVEYNAGCWIIRGVVQRFQAATSQTTSLFFVQLEFNGFARIGSNPLELLRRSIPGYTFINQSTPDSRSLDFGPLGGPAGPSAVGTAVEPIRSSVPSAYRTYD